MVLIKEDTLNFLKEIKENNNRLWFEKNKGRYVEARENIRLWMIEVMELMKKQDDRIIVDPKKCVGRIYRDIRFSKNKDPYRPFLGAFVLRAKEGENCEYYVHFEPGNIFAGGGIYAPTPLMLRKIRDDIEYSTENLNRIVSSGAFKKIFGSVQGEKLSRAPKGFSPEHKDIEWLKLKQFLVLKSFHDEEVVGNDFSMKVLDCFNTAKPLFDHLDKAINFEE